MLTLIQMAFACPDLLSRVDSSQEQRRDDFIFRTETSRATQTDLSQKYSYIQNKRFGLDGLKSLCLACIRGQTGRPSPIKLHRASSCRSNRHTLRNYLSRISKKHRRWIFTCTAFAACRENNESHFLTSIIMQDDEKSALAVCHMLLVDSAILCILYVLPS